MTLLRVETYNTGPDASGVGQILVKINDGRQGTHPAPPAADR